MICNTYFPRKCHIYIKNDYYKIKMLFYLCLTLTLTAGYKPKLFRNEFLQKDDYDFMDDYDEKDGPLVDPPAGHGLPGFSVAPYELEPDQLVAEYDAWKLTEEAAEQEFYAQTDEAIAEAEEKLANCATLYTTEEEIADCEAEAMADAEAVNQSVEDLQSAHGAEEEIFEAALEFLIAEYYAEHPDYVSQIGAGEQ